MAVSSWPRLSISLSRPWETNRQCFQRNNLTIMRWDFTSCSIPWPRKLTFHSRTPLFWPEQKSCESFEGFARFKKFHTRKHKWRMRTWRKSLPNIPTCANAQNWRRIRLGNEFVKFFPAMTVAIWRSINSSTCFPCLAKKHPEKWRFNLPSKSMVS